jgi:hypothetical protein
LDDTALYRELLADFIGDFPEMTDDDKALHPDPAVAIPLDKPWQQSFAGMVTGR